MHLLRRVKEEVSNRQDIIEILQNKNNLKDVCYGLECYHNCISELKTRKSTLTRYPLVFEEEE